MIEIHNIYPWRPFRMKAFDMRSPDLLPSEVVVCVLVPGDEDLQGTHLRGQTQPVELPTNLKHEKN